MTFAKNLDQNKNDQYHLQASSNLIINPQDNLFPLHSQAYCKICLEKGDDMISPCLCKGTLQFVHENCIKQWLKHILVKKNQFRDISGSGFEKCELCKEQIGFSYVDRKYCGCHTFYQRIKTQKADLCYYITALFLFLTAIGTLLYLLINSIISSDLKQTTIVIFVIFQTLLLLGFLALITNCIFQYFISREISISTVLNKYNVSMVSDNLYACNIFQFSLIIQMQVNKQSCKDDK